MIDVTSCVYKHMWLTDYDYDYSISGINKHVVSNESVSFGQ